MANQEAGDVSGTKDKNYNLVWFLQSCLENSLRLETYINDAVRDGDDELADLFRRAQSESKKGAEQAKKMLAGRLA